MNNILNEKRGRVLLFALLLILIVPSHLIGIDRATTIDEPWWVISGSNYYYALTNRDFANTLYDYHPAVTTTWMVTTGMVAYFPEYRGFGQGYFDPANDPDDGLADALDRARGIHADALGDGAAAQGAAWLVVPARDYQHASVPQAPVFGQRSVYFAYHRA